MEVKKGESKSCGCLRRELLRENMIGKKFGQLEVIAESPRKGERTKKNRKGYGVWWICFCDCGKAVEIIGQSLRTNHTRSCGCIAKNNLSNRARTHGFSKTSEYSIYMGMKRRCYNKNCVAYFYYGERGIKICDKWLYGDKKLCGFLHFLKDMGKRPSKKYSVDRIDCNKDYSPANCRWATQKEQTRNSRRAHLVEYKGITKPLMQWGEEFGLNPNTTRGRWRRWKRDIVRILETPVKNTL